MSVPVVSPASPLNKEGKTATNFTSDQSVTWAATGGVLSAVTATSATWTAPNETGTYTLTATNAGSEVRTITITVIAVLSVLLDWRKPGRAKKKVLVFEPEEGPQQSREKGSRQRFYEIGAESVSQEDFLEIEAFWNAHHPNKQFILDDTILGRRTLCLTDADFNFSYNGHDSFDWNSAIKEAWPYGVEV